MFQIPCEIEDIHAMNQEGISFFSKESAYSSENLNDISVSCDLFSIREFYNTSSGNKRLTAENDNQNKDKGSRITTIPFKNDIIKFYHFDMIRNRLIRLKESFPTIYSTLTVPPEAYTGVEITAEFVLAYETSINQFLTIIKELFDSVKTL
jgi:hypothetical protein